MAQLYMDDRNADQIAYWNGAAGESWTDRQQTQDVLLKPVLDILVREANVSAGERVIDIGCGCGASSIEFARRVGSGGKVIGLDISAPMLARAREQAPPGLPLEFIQSDATVYPFQPAAADLLTSRFGVMFFARPADSFANIRKGLRQGGRVVFACWREPRDNGWLMTPLQAVYLHVPRMPPLGPDDPGPFSFASEERVRNILTEAGYSSVAMKRHDLSLDIAIGRGLDVAVKTALDVGPSSRALAGHPDSVRAAAARSIREQLAKVEKAGRVELPASIWIVTASNP